MKKYSEFRKISKVFHQYGIDLIGKKKYDRFDQDLRMDHVFVSGLIFELEYELSKELPDEVIPRVEVPAQLISLLLN